MKLETISPIKKWEKLFTDIILSRGADYCKKKVVENLQQDETKIEADVVGTETYHVHIALSGNGISELTCNCPYAADGSKNCKHMATVLFAALDPEKAAKLKSAKKPLKPLPPPKPNCTQVTIRIEDEDTTAQRYCAIPEVKVGDYVVFLLNERETVGLVEEVIQMPRPIDAYGLGRRNHVLRITEKPEPTSPFTIRILPPTPMCRLTLARENQMCRMRVKRVRIEKNHIKIGDTLLLDRENGEEAVILDIDDLATDDLPYCQFLTVRENPDFAEILRNKAALHLSEENEALSEFVLHNWTSEIEEARIPFGVDRITAFAFEDNWDVRRVVITGPYVHLDPFAFGHNESIEEISIEDDRVYCVPASFEGCVSLRKLSLPYTCFYMRKELEMKYPGVKIDFLLNGNVNVSGIIYSADMTKVVCCTNQDIAIYHSPSTVTTIYPRAFSGCSLMKRFLLTPYVTDRGRGCLAGCFGLEEIAVAYGITEKNTGDIKDESVNGRLLTQAEQAQRVALIYRIRQEGFQQVMEEVAYTWFNRFCALRFMEVNNYLPTRIRVFTDEENAFKPQILAEAIHMEMDGLDMDRVYQLKSDNKTEELYKYLLITQCNALYSILPGMFQQIADYTELLLPDNLLREGSVIEQMISLIPEEDWLVPEDHDKDSIQIIGWLYQYYNAEPKDQVFANLKKNIKISKHDIPAATQLFTPDWIVRYMVENSLGRLWVEGHPDDELKAGWKYYLEEAEQEPDVQAQLAKIREEYAAIKPEDIKCIDPCMGSGHILVYMFDVLVQIYQAYGYSTREAVQSIVENNLYGLDIDDRAAQLAYFAVMMKARQYDRRFFSRGIQPHVCAIQESAKMPEDAWDYFGAEKDIAQRVYMAFANAKEYGSLIEPNMTLAELDALDARLTEMDHMADYGNLAVQALMGTVLQVIDPLMKQARMLVQKYDAVVTNPPYMGGSGMNPHVLQFVKDSYTGFSEDLYTCFIKRALEWVYPNRYISLMTSYTWMFLTTFTKARQGILKQSYIHSLIQPEYHAFFQEAFVPICSFTINSSDINYTGVYAQLDRFKKADEQEARAQEALVNRDCEWRYSMPRDIVKGIPGWPLAYWLPQNTIRLFTETELMGNRADLRQGLITGDNDRFLRFWHECDQGTIGNSYSDNKKWYFYHKGGEYRKWYGNITLVVNWQNNGDEIVNFRDEKGRQRSRPQNVQYYFREGFTWTALTIADFNVRYMPSGAIFDAKGSSGFVHNQEELKYYIALCNSKVAMVFLSFLAPTMDYSAGAVSKVPIIIDTKYSESINTYVDKSISISQKDWDAFETSWDFQRHPLLPRLPLDSECIFIDVNGRPGSLTITSHRISECFDTWRDECDTRFAQLKSNEEEINRIFIDIYGLQDELTPEVDDKDVTVRHVDLSRDIRSLISYAVGCMFGRYSLSKSGLAFAGSEWNAANYTSGFQPDKDGILPISDDDYFADDIVGRFVRFVEVVYGKETLEENLAFIAKALGGTGTPRDVIRSYFLNDFYADHLKIYQKRPIYWLFDSGKKNGFKALIYMHRYAPDTIARIRTDYVHEQQSRYRTAIVDLENRIISASTGERVKLTKQLTKVKAQDEELRLYEEKIHHLADQMISIDLDDGVKVNYAKFADVLAKIK